MNRSIVFGALLSLILGGSLAASPVFVADGAAIRGYDPVAYFTVGRPVRGQAQFSYQWNGANWRFSSQQNLNLFKANPQRYAPAYGGYCAYAMGHYNKLVEVDPTAWKIVGGRLFLNYDSDVQEDWLEDMQNYIRQGDANWQGHVNAH
ncbi:MAG: YHS domain-containing protein [Leptospirales bacterium]|nr:YHS domain-containing protein [Leptospirales bacterium]